jgi:hypothetical protein
MAYIGKQPVVGNFQVCDAISVVNGQAAYTMQVGSANVEPENANHMLVSLNGILQKPGSSFTISGSTITFASNLATGDVIDFIILLGDVLNIGTPSDGAVVTASIADNAVTAAKLASGAGGKVLQVVTDISTTEESSTSSTFADTNLSLSITPSATTSKILVFSDINSMRKLSGDTKIDLKLLRGSTQIAFGRYANTDSTATLSQSSSSFHVLDTPSTTSAVTYKIQLANSSAAGTVYILSNSSTGTLTAMEIGA